MNYNEALLEGFAVVAVRSSASVTASGTTSIGPFNSSCLNRVVFDILGVGDGATTAFTCVLQSASTSGATYSSLPTSTSVGTINAISVVQGTTSALQRFEFTMEAVQQARDAYTGTTAIGQWLRLLVSGATGTATWSAVAYGVSNVKPAADIVIDPFTGTTTPVVTAANQYLNGTPINNNPNTTTARGTNVLPY